MEWCKCGKQAIVRAHISHRWYIEDVLMCWKCYYQLRGHSNWLELDKSARIISDGRKTIRVKE
jgi:hypothetical protein